MNKQELMESIATTIYDYRSSEIKDINVEHVERWINQFSECDKVTILSEINNILNKYYFSKQRVKKYLRMFLKREDIFGKNLKSGILKANFLSIQEKGNSQKDLLDLIDDILREDYNINIKSCGGSNKYIYIDDCIYTGNRFRYDIVPWIQSKKIKPNSKLVTYHIAYHTMGAHYAYKYIKQEADKINLELECWSDFKINNCKNSTENFGVLWPKEIDDDNVKTYKQIIEDRIKNYKLGLYRIYLFRNDNQIKSDALFSSLKSREIVENAFLKIGSKLVVAANDPKESIRPLGFEKLESMGFGTFFCSYRNIANNCPLALWYGDPINYDVYNPLGLWYPLLPRRTNDKINSGELIWGEL